LQVFPWPAAKHATEITTLSKKNEEISMKLKKIWAWLQGMFLPAKAATYQWYFGSSH